MTLEKAGSIFGWKIVRFRGLISIAFSDAMDAISCKTSEKRKANMGGPMLKQSPVDLTSQGMVPQRQYKALS